VLPGEAAGEVVGVPSGRGRVVPAVAPRAAPTRGPGSRTELRTELSDVSGGRVVIETRWLAEARADARWETTICPADDSDPDGAAAAVFATVMRLPTLGRVRRAVGAGPSEPRSRLTGAKVLPARWAEPLRC